jgi:hypothetical protein
VLALAGAGLLGYRLGRGALPSLAGAPTAIAQATPSATVGALLATPPPGSKEQIQTALPASRTPTTAVFVPTPTTVPTRTPIGQEATPTPAARPPTTTPGKGREPGSWTPRIVGPANDAKYQGYNARVLLEWSEVRGLGPNDYYVVRVPYDDYGGIAEFWTKELCYRLPGHLSESTVGFRDRRYTWTVQVMRCTGNCDEVYNPNVTKQGSALGAASREGTFTWEPDFGR